MMNVPHKIFDGKIIPLTEEEILEQQRINAIWEADAPKRAAAEQIRLLEEKITSRRLRDAALTEAGKAWLQDIEDQIAAQRVLL